MNLNKGWLRLFALLAFAVLLAAVFPNFVKAVDVNVLLYTCVANDNSAGETTFSGSCDGGAGATNTYLNADDSSIETHTSNRKFAGVKITTTNWSVSDCSTVTAVTLYYKWWGTAQADGTYYIKVSDDGTTWGTAVSTANPISEAAGMSSVNVTALDGWDCGDFGSSGAAQIMSNLKDGTNDTYTYSWDVLFFTVTYSVKGTLTPSINKPSIDGNTYWQNVNFDVSGVVSCTTANCGTVDSTLRYCQGGAGCTGWMDLNSSAGSLRLVSGSNPQSTTLNSGQSYDVNWLVVGSVAGTYELRLGAAGTTADDGNTSGTDRTITVEYGTLSPSINKPNIDNNTYLRNSNFDFSGVVSCSGGACGNVDTNLQYCQGGAGCTVWMDLNSSTGSLRLISGSNPQSSNPLAQNASYDVNWVLTSNIDGTFELRLSTDGTNADAATTSGTDRTITVSYGALTINHNKPSIDNNSYSLSVNFGVSGNIACGTNNCGSVDTILQYCIGTSCTNWMDLNAVDGNLRLASGTNKKTQTLNNGQNYDVNWLVIGADAATFELRISTAGTTASDANGIGTDRTIVLSGAADTTFSISYPASGCTQGKGSIDAGADCELCYFETTDLTGQANQTQVACQGQTAGTAFFVFNNQSTSSSDLNWFMDLNAILPSVFKLKISTLTGGYQASCDENAETGCVNVDSNALTFISTVNYSASSEDENGFVWTDFVGALPSDSNSLVLTHTSTGS